MRYAPTLLSCALAASLVAPELSAQSAKDEAIKQNVPAVVVRYVTTVIRHAPGQNDAAVSDLAAWTSRDFEEALDGLKVLIKVGDPNAPPAFLERFSAQSLSTNMLLKRAAMLHSDVALFRRSPEGGYQLPRDAGAPMEHRVASDGRVVGTVAGTFHWDAARRVASFVSPERGRDADVLLWYQATAALLQLWNDFYTLPPHLASARALFPNDPVLLMFEGVLHENFADPRIQNAFANAATGRRSTCPAMFGCAPPAPGQLILRSAEQEWREAERFFDFALKIDPDLAEARVRLGRVLGLQDRHGDAIAHLRKVLDAGPSVPPVLRYFAWLLIGRELQATGRADDAEHAFVEAEALHPRSQEARLGLSQVAQSRGDRAEALRHLNEIGPPRPAGDGGDPWWAYDRIHSPSVQELMATLASRLSR